MTKTHKCPLCSKTFSDDEIKPKCGGCSMSKGCKMICCPNCHYSFTEESGIINYLKKLVASQKKTPKKL